MLFQRPRNPPVARGSPPQPAAEDIDALLLVVRGAEDIATALPPLQARGKPFVLLATVNAALQRVPAREEVATSAWAAHVGNTIDLDKLTGYLVANGYARTGTVRERGEFALRGGIVDIFPSGFDAPIRLDMFGEVMKDPAFADLPGLPPALMSGGTTDHLVDDTLMLSARWAAAGSEVELFVAPDMPHGFMAYPCAMTDAWLQVTRTWFAGILGR